ncbi:hypothetical protein ZWY2020_009412 [Hordeum vulgare]|nr:hypothetical protein ZWY2020_009412 [Hordeum vulgare]
MVSGGDPRVFGEVGIGPEICRVHDWVLEGMELRFAFLVHIIRDWYMLNAENKKKFQGDEDFDEVANDDGQHPHDFDDDPKYPPNDDSSEAPNGGLSEAPNGDQPSVVASSARFEVEAQGTDNQEEKRRSNEHKVHEEQSDGKKLKDQTEAPMLFMSNYETL